MAKGRLALVAAAIAVVLIGAVYISRKPQPSASGKTSPVPDTRQQPVSSPPAETATPPDLKGRGSSSAARATVANTPFLADRYAANAAEGFRRLSARSEPRAQSYAADLLASCTHFIDARYEKTLAHIEKQSTPDAVKVMQRLMAQEHRDRCSALSPEEVAREFEIRRRLADKGDASAIDQVRRSPNLKPSELVEMARAGAASGDPLVARSIGMFFAQLPAGLAIDLGNGHAANPQEIRDGWYLAACSLGEPCDRTNGIVAARCVLSGFCDATTLEESLIRYSYPPAQVENLLRARDVIVRGITTGVWPPGFWPS